MLIKVRFFGSIRELTKEKWMVIELPENSSILDLIKELSNKIHPALMEKLVKEDRKLNPDFSILLNGRNIVHLNGLSTKLRNEDTVSIFSVAGGG